ncbi:MAG: hypothetical protein AAF636_21285 [Pseudomonadota bacterium]
MRGKILGVDGEAGVILADGDERYSFALSEWKDGTAPRRGQVVDFVATDGQASEIYPALGVMSGASLGSGSLRDEAQSATAAASELLARAQDNDLMRQIVAKVRAFPRMALAAVMLFAFFFMTYASFGWSGNEITQMGLSGVYSESTLSEFNDELDPLRTQTEVMGAQVDTMIANQRSRVSGPNVARIAELSNVRDAISQYGWMLTMAYSFWLIPLGALATIALHWLDKHAFAKLAGVAMSVPAIVAAAYIPLWEGIIIGVIPDALRDRTAPLIEDAFALEWGGWTMVLCALGVLGLSFRRAPQIEA